MSLTIKDIEKVANLARLELADGEAERFKGQLDTILGYVDKLNQLNTDGIAPTSHAIPVSNVFREDRVVAPLGQQRALSNAPDKAEDAYFRVPKVVE